MLILIIIIIRLVIMTLPFFPSLGGRANTQPERSDRNLERELPPRESKTMKEEE